MRRFLIAIFLLLSAASASAYTLDGTVENGTNGVVPAQMTGVLVNPAGGMATEQTFDIVDGRFTVEGLSEATTIYLLRVDYEGVTYTTPVRYEQKPQVDVTLTIYEQTTSTDGLEISVPQYSARREGDHLVLMRVHEVINVTEPPVTVAGEAGNFRFHLPAQMEEVTGVFVSSLGVPIERSAIPTEQANVYRVDYPLRPGMTRIGISYVVPYTGDAITLTETALYPIKKLTVFQVDPDMALEFAPTDMFGQAEGAHGMVGHTASDIAAGTEFAVTFTGGSKQLAASPGTEHGEGHSVVLIPDPSNNVSLIAMAALLFVLLGFVFMVVKTPTPASERLASLTRHRERLLNRLVTLDSLSDTGVVSNDVYRAQRADTKAQLAVVLQQLAEANRGEGSADAGDTTTSSNHEATGTNPSGTGR